MEIIIREFADQAIDLTARLIAQRLRIKPDLVLGLATGRTMEGVYTKLVELHTDRDLDFSGCHSFNLDEYIGLPPEHEQSYRYYMNDHLFSRVNIRIENTHLPDGVSEDIKAACAEYERLITSLGGIDLQLLGIGEDGHIGFNESLSALHSRTRDKSLTPITIRQNAPFFGGAENMPKRALTMGVGTILEAREIVLLATGKHKAQIVAQALEGPITSMISATALQLHSNCKIIVDEAAASNLKEQEYYRWIFENEPDWEPFRGETV